MEIRKDKLTGLEYLYVESGEPLNIRLEEDGNMKQMVSLKVTAEDVKLLVSNTGGGLLQESISSNNFKFHITPLILKKRKACIICEKVDVLNGKYFCTKGDTKLVNCYDEPCSDFKEKV